MFKKLLVALGLVLVVMGGCKTNQKLADEAAALKKEVEDLKKQFEQFRRQFE